jgi:cellulose synthase/poly-beta-1,6-N-acetylglucosamine synthase-like glycosyltransferase
MKILFWVSVSAIFYVYAVYPVVIYVWGTFFRRFAAKSYDTYPLSVVLAVRDEEQRIAGRIENLLDQEYPPELIEIIVVSDGSVDRTAEIARNFEDERIKVIELDRPGGKAAAINAGVQAASNEIIVFADARQDFSRNAYAELVSMFHDEKVGAVSGELVFVEGEGGEMREGVGLYWKYEKLIRRKESAADSVVGASGSIYAIRKSLFSPLPPYTILDDFLLPMRIVLKGYRVLFIRSAKAFDRVSPNASREFKRKVRTLAGNFQAVKLEPALLDPRRNRLFFQLVSHKLGRLFVPYFCLAALVADFQIAGAFYRFLLVLQILFYASALLKFTPLGRKSCGGVFRVAWTFIVLNAAAVGGLIVFATGREKAVWR